jgi:hypothetical protein
MAKYRFLQAAYVDGALINAGQVCDLRDDWVPNGNVEPLDASALSAFWEAGPQPLGLVRQQLSDVLLTRYPSIYWRQINKEEFQLTGSGASLGPKKATRPMEVP